MPKPRKYSNKVRLQFAKLIAEGKSAPQAADKLGMPRETVKDWLASAEIREQVAHLKKKALDGIDMKVTREALLEKLDKLRNLPATRANGTIICKATEVMLRVLERFEPRAAGATPELPPDIYQPAWLDKANRQPEQ